MLLRLNDFIGKHFPWFVLSCVAVGLVLGENLARYMPLTMYFFAFNSFANSLGGGFTDLARVARHPKPVIVVMLLLHVIIPLLTLGIGRLLFPDAPLFVLGLLLEFVLPTGISSLMWVGIGGGHVPLCLAVILLDTLLAPVLVPLSLRIFSGTVVQMDSISMMIDLLYMVAIPAVIAMTLHQLTRGRAAETLKPKLDPFCRIFLLLIITVNASGCTSFLRRIDRTLLLVIAAVFTVTLLGFFLGWLAGRLLKRPYPEVLSMALNVGNRNISAGAVIAAAYFPAEVLFPVAFSPVFFQIVVSFTVKILQRGEGKRQK